MFFLEAHTVHGSVFKASPCFFLSCVADRDAGAQSREEGSLRLYGLFPALSSARSEEPPPARTLKNKVPNVYPCTVISWTHLHNRHFIWFDFSCLMLLLWVKLLFASRGMFLFGLIHNNFYTYHRCLWLVRLWTLFPSVCHEASFFLYFRVFDCIM